MASRKQRIHDFHGSDHAYIIYLESLVPEEIANRPLPYPSPRPRTPVRDEAIESFHNDGSIKFVSYTLPAVQSRKRKRTVPRWELEMDEWIRDITAEDWSSRRTAIGLSSQSGILMALDTTIHGPQTDLIGSEAVFSMVCHDRSNAVLRILNSFATTTTALQAQETFTIHMVSFRVLVFVSLCCVALYHGADREAVDGIMRKCVSATSEKNLTRLRKGALWINRMMAQLAADGFNYLAYELFVLWGRSLAQYGRFADAGDGGFAYFRSRVPQLKPKLEIQASLPFWIPFIIKIIVGDTFSLPAICTALSYGAEPQILYYPRYYEIYYNRHIPLPEPNTMAYLPDHSQANTSDSSVGGNEIRAASDSSNPIHALLLAAQESDRLESSNEMRISASPPAMHNNNDLHFWNTVKGTNFFEPIEFDNLHFWNTSSFDSYIPCLFEPLIMDSSVEALGDNRIEAGGISDGPLLPIE